MLTLAPGIPPPFYVRYRTEKGPPRRLPLARENSPNRDLIVRVGGFGAT
jgi:hypothetical protein